MSDDSEQLIEDTRLELGDTNEVLDEDLIAFHVKKSKRKVERKVPDASEEQLYDLVPVVAALRFITRDKDTFLEAKEGSEFTKRWDISEYISMLEAERDDLIEEIEGFWAVTYSSNGTTLTR